VRVIQRAFTAGSWPAAIRRGFVQHHPAGVPAVEAEARDAAVEAEAREVVGVAAADLPDPLGSASSSRAWLLDHFDHLRHEAWPAVKSVLRRVLETRRKIAGGC
jgi:hypothetical protein